MPTRKCFRAGNQSSPDLMNTESSKINITMKVVKNRMWRTWFVIKKNLVTWYNIELLMLFVGILMKIIPYIRKITSFFTNCFTLWNKYNISKLYFSIKNISSMFIYVLWNNLKNLFLERRKYVTKLHNFLLVIIWNNLCYLLLFKLKHFFFPESKIFEFLAMTFETASYFGACRYNFGLYFPSFKFPAYKIILERKIHKICDS